MRMVRTLGVGMALSLATAQVQAVDVDRIELRSRLGEPLLAEIPVTGASAADLAQLQAGLASPTTFARIGLPRPQGMVAGLRFELVRGPRPLIRVTSAEPVRDAFVTFLLQVDAPQGRLVREFSLALEPASSIDSDLPPAIAAPLALPSEGLVDRDDPVDALPGPPLSAREAGMAATGAAARAVEMPPIPVLGRAPRATTVAPIPLQGGRAADRAAASVGATGPRGSAATVGGARQVHVGRGGTLTAAVADMRIEGATVAQAMLAVLRANPHAFGAGNIHQLRHGVVLRAPAAPELTRFDAASADAVVRLQTAQWQGGGASTSALPTALRPLVAPVAMPPRGVAPTASARLEIASIDPEVAGAGVAGVEAPAGDPVARQRVAADLVAARYTEFQQMQQRIAELEQAQRAQQRLLLRTQRQLAAQRPQVAGMWPWLLGSLVLGVALAGAVGARRPSGPGRIASALATRVRGTAAGRASTAR